MANTVTIDVQARGEKALDSMRKSLISLAPAAVPVAAALTTVVAQMGAAGVATAAFGAAVAPQAKAMGEAAKSGAALSSSMYKLPPATQQAAKSFLQLKSSYKGWSDSLAGDTMPVVTKGLQTMTAVLPQLSGMVKGAATQFDRLMTAAAGGVASGAFTKLIDKITQLSDSALKSFTDEVIHLSRAMSEGSANGPLQKFIDYAKSNGPAVKDTLTNIAQAVGNLLQAMATAGPSMLTVVNALAKMVAAIPPEFLGVLLKVYTGFKLISTVSSGILVVSGAIAKMGEVLRGMYVASLASSTTLGSLRAAFMSLSVGMRAALITTGIGAIVVALGMLSGMGQKTPPDVDKITTSLKGLAETGKNTGESAKAWGSNFDGLSKTISRLDPKGFDGFLQGWAKFIGMDSTQVKNAKDDIDSLDKGLAGLVKGGKADVAARALAEIGKKLKPKDFAELKKNLDDYKSSLADQSYEAKLAAEAQGVFGKAAQDTQSAIDAQKQAADGLRDSIVALNNLNRQALGGQIGMEAAIDAAQQGAKKYGDVLTMTNGELNLNGKNAQEAAQLISNLAAKTDEYGTSARDNGASLEKVNDIYQHGREHLMEVAQQMGLTKAEAKGLAEQLLKTPEDITTKVKMQDEDATHDLESFNAALRKTPHAHSVTLSALSKAGEQVLESFGFKVKRLPNGKVTITAKAGQALSAIGNVKAAVDSLHSKTIGIGIYKTEYLNTVHRGPSVPGVTPYADGGPVTGGSGNKDDVPILAMGGEFMVRKGPAQKYRSLLEAINSDRLPKFAKGGAVTKSEQEARNSARGDLTISHFGSRAGYKNDEFRSALGKPSDIGGLVDALNQWRNVILKATHGAQESKLLKALDKAGSTLLKQEKKLADVNKALDKAKSKLEDLKQAAAQLKDSVKSGLIGEADITKAAGASDSQVTINTLLGTMGASAANTKQFAQMLTDLKKKGVNGDLIQQIAEAGIGGGGMETAAALLGGSKADIQRINDYQKQIGKSAGDAGKTAADAMYGAGIKAADGLVKGLTAKKKAIETAMMNIAKSMEKAIKKALGIKSPSKVMEDVGHFTAEGFARGMTRNRNVRPAWESMLNVPRTARTGGHGNYGAQPVVLEIRSGGSKMDDLIVEIVRKHVRVKGGGNVQRHLGN